MMDTNSYVDAENILAFIDSVILLAADALPSPIKYSVDSSDVLAYIDFVCQQKLQPIAKPIAINCPKKSKTKSKRQNPMLKSFNFN